MSVITDQLSNHPSIETFDTVELARAVEACLEAAAVATMCADACLAEDDVVSMRRCIQLDLDCATICNATAEVLSRPNPDGDVWRRLVETCARACAACASECETHDRSKHCLTCADACRRCEMACQQLLAVAA